MSPKKASAGVRHDKEWVASRTGEAELNRLVEAGVLSDHVTAGWRLALGEPFPMPHTEKVVVFEDYFLVRVRISYSSIPEGSVGALGG